MELAADTQHGQECKGERIIGFDDRPDCLIEPKSAETGWQSDPERFEQPSDLILQIDTAVEDGFTGCQQGFDVMALAALHMNRVVPARPKNLSDAARIRLVARRSMIHRIIDLLLHCSA